ncbi:MAG: beta-galactosidase trimerization domain-containing protein [Armatimonadetes bacterium]|nr:beta-galactosidase trimerization domain-containing protein [Armatimonadota bacterium]
MNDFFPVGVTYGATLPRDEWEADMSEIEGSGFNCIRVLAGVHSPEDFSYILDLASDHDIRVMVALDYRITADTACEPCLSDEPTAPGVEKFLKSTVERLKAHKAIYAWMVPTPDPSHPANWQISAIKSVDQTRPVITEVRDAPVGVPAPVAVSCRLGDLPPVATAAKWQKERYVGYVLRRARRAEALAMSLQAGPSSGWIDFGPLDIGVMTWTCVANGARGLIYDRWDPGDSPTREPSIKTIDGKYWHGIKRIAADMREAVRIPGLFFARPPRAAAAVLMPRSPDLPPPDGRAEGAYRLLADNFISVEFIDETASLDDLRAYKTVYIPYLPTCPKPFASDLTQYVRGGGSVIAESPFAQADESGDAYPEVPGAGLAEVFGCKSRGEAGEDACPVSTTGIAQGVFTYVGSNIRFYIDGPTEELDVQSGRAAIVDFLERRTLLPSGPAMVIGKFGEGKTAYIAGSLSSAYYGIEHPYVRELLSGLFDWLEVPRQVEVSGLTKGRENEFEVGVLEGIDPEGRRAVICVNHSDMTVHPALTLPLGPPSVVRELFTISEAQADTSGNQLRIMTHVPERGVRAYYETSPAKG